eukprot:sb/3472340/
MISPMEICLLFVGILVLAALSTILAGLHAFVRRLSSLEASVQGVTVDLATSEARVFDYLTALKWGVLRVADDLKRHQTDSKTQSLAALVKLLDVLVREHMATRDLIKESGRESWLAISQVVARAARRIAGQPGNSSTVEVQTDVELGIVPGKDAPVPSTDSVILQME